LLKIYFVFIGQTNVQLEIGSNIFSILFIKMRLFYLETVATIAENVDTNKKIVPNQKAVQDQEKIEEGCFFFTKKFN
jgi:hypothetical protein